MKLFTWVDGRQENTKYKKWCFLYFKICRLGFDGYILHYKPKTVLYTHKDPIDGKHYRLNIKLKGMSYFEASKCIVKIGDFLAFFRPDIRYHHLVVITRTYKISLGFAIFNK